MKSESEFWFLQVSMGIYAPSDITRFRLLQMSVVDVGPGNIQNHAQKKGQSGK